MIIQRDNNIYRLTPEELEFCYRERDMYYLMEDVALCYEADNGKECPYADMTRRIIAEKAKDILESNDEYWSIYWDSFERAMDEYEEYAKQTI